MTEIVAMDIGGTHARFAICEIVPGNVVSLGRPTTYQTAAHPGLEAAWETFAGEAKRPLPRLAVIAFAGPIEGVSLKLTNGGWELNPAKLGARLGLDRCTVINDFAAVAHAVAQLDDSHLQHLCGQEAPPTERQVVSVIGPGTGLGVALLLRDGADYRIVETEGGHASFAPHDEVEDQILAYLRPRLSRVSVERIVSGSGLVNIYQALAAIQGVPAETRDEKELWTAALSGEGSLVAAALDRLCRCLGGVAGDIALAHGAASVIIAGGLGHRLANRLPASGFCDRFVDKGSFRERMEAISVKLMTYPQPGLYGAAAALAAELAGKERFRFQAIEGSLN